MPCCIWGVFASPGCQETPILLAFEGLGGGGHCEFLTPLVPHSVCLFVCARFP